MQPKNKNTEPNTKQMLPKPGLFLSTRDPQPTAMYDIISWQLQSRIAGN
jgi:hypothetical protein